MTSTPALTRNDLDRIRKIDTCTVSNAIERLEARLRNEGQISGSIAHCVFPHLPPVVGYAVTGCMRSAMEPVAGRTYHENIGWWRYVATIPEPRIMVVLDRDRSGGALLGEMHALIGRALGCVGYITNGGVRDLASVEAMGFQLFAGSVEVSHKYAHISEYGRPVQIDGLTISPGDLLHGDRHGVHSIPLAIAPQIPDMVADIRREEDELRKLCRSPMFSLDRLEQKLRDIPGGGFEVPLNGS
jgi:4-hydroxy-4-methyl-2-oxoglutarate aldolase